MSTATRRCGGRWGLPGLDRSQEPFSDLYIDGRLTDGDEDEQDEMTDTSDVLGEELSPFGWLRWGFNDGLE